jgi:IS605 OrfB family transposase
MSSIADKWGKEDTKQEKLLKCLKIKIYPTKVQVPKWNEWLQTSRYIYNKSLESVKMKKIPLNKIALRDFLVTKSTRKSELYSKYMEHYKFLKDSGASKDVLSEVKLCINALPRTSNPNVEQWQERTPKSVREQAVGDLYNAYSTNLKMFKEGKKPFFQMKFRKKSAKSQTFAMDETIFKIKDNGVQLLSEDIVMSKREWTRLKRAHQIGALCKSARIQKDQHGWWLLVAEELDKKTKPKVPISMVGCDLGVRDFVTLYGHTGNQVSTSNVGYGRSTLTKLRNKIDMLKDKRLNRKNRTLRKYEYKIQNIVNEIHYNTIKYLTTKYDAIVIGDINSQGILQGNLNKFTKREVQGLSFYKFKQRLKEKCLSEGTLLNLINEAYTSKTCTYCGNRYEIGSNKVYTCKPCDIKYDRDEGSARSIFMKGILC